MFKKLRPLSIIIFSIVMVLFAVIITTTTIFLQLETTMTNMLFGGYQSEIITGEEGDVEYFESEFYNLDQVIANSYNVNVASSAEGSVLFSNEVIDDSTGEKALPLAKGSKVSMFGISSTDPVLTNMGAARFTPDGNEIDFKDAFEDAGLEINETLYSYYTSNSSYKAERTYADHNNLNDMSWDQMNTTAKTDSEYGDAAIMVISRYAAENTDLAAHSLQSKSDANLTNGDYLQLTSREMSMLENLKSQKENGTFERIIVIFNSSNPIESNYLEQYDVDAQLWIGLPGEMGMYGVGQIMVGDVNPSGHLTDMWWKDNRFNPTESNFGGHEYADNSNGGFWHTSPYVVYQEGIYSGYKYAETRYEDVVMKSSNAGEYNYAEQVAHSFGHGLSYTEFEYTNNGVTYNSATDEYTVSVTVENTGKVAGKDVVQIYVQSPYTDYDKTNNIEKASVDLVAFDKTTKIEAGESETLEIVVEGREFANYDAYGYKTYIREAGDYYLSIGTDAHNAVNNILASKGYTTADGMTENGDADLAEKLDLAADYTTYSVSNAGADISNLFDFADPNRNGDSNSVEYYSRNDWAGTVNYIFADDKHTYVANHAVIHNTTLIEEARAQDTSKMVATDEVEYPTYSKPANEDGTNLMLIEMRVDEEGNKISIDDPKWETFLDQLSWDEIANLLSHGQRSTQAIDSVGKPATIDQNGTCGFGQQTYYNSSQPMQKYGLAYETDDDLKGEYCTGFTSSDILASSFNKKLAYAYGAAVGEESLWSGMAAIYGYGFNIHRSAYNGRRHEYFSEDSYLTGVMGGWASLGSNDKGCYVYNKHFAFHEQETCRYTGSSYEVWASEQTLREGYLEAWMVSLDIVEDRQMNVMTSFSRVGAMWSGNSYELMSGWLLGEAGMVGFSVSDWTSGYMGYASGVLAGHDLPDGDTTQFNDKSGGNGIDTSTYPDKGNYGELAWAMRDSARRICYTVVHSNAMNGIGASTTIITYTPTWVIVFNTIEVITISIMIASAVFMVAMIVLSHVNIGKKSTTEKA